LAKLEEKERNPFMKLSFENQVALVTGAGFGIGLATARAFAAEGASVMLADVNEAAAHKVAEQLIADASSDEFDRVLAINLRGVWNCLKYELREMRKQGSGAALEYASMGIRINAVCPGTIDTHMVAGMMATQAEAIKELMKDVPIGRPGPPEEIADAALWLCSSGASSVIGQALAVDGGYTED
jgi:NAD(P)-dependent dehydrogenase (short-subunit alcohol dehydrogenase family)